MKIKNETIEQRDERLNFVHQHNNISIEEMQQYLIESGRYNFSYCKILIKDIIRSSYLVEKAYEEGNSKLALNISRSIEHNINIFIHRIADILINIWKEDKV